MLAVRLPGRGGSRENLRVPHFSSARRPPPDKAAWGVAFSITGVIVNYNTGPVRGGVPPARKDMNIPKTHEQTLRTLTLVAIVCLTLASMLA